MSAVENYLLELTGEQAKIANHLHALLTNELGLKASIKYKIPFYTNLSWICYINPIKDNGIELAFTRANELSNNHGILDFKDRKQVAGIPIYELAAIPIDAILDTIQEAILLDETVKYRSKRSKNPL